MMRWVDLRLDVVLQLANKRAMLNTKYELSLQVQFLKKRPLDSGQFCTEA